MLLALLCSSLSVVLAQTVLEPNTLSHFNGSALYTIPQQDNLTLTVCARNDRRTKLQFILDSAALTIQDEFASIDTSQGGELRVIGTGEYIVALTASQNDAQLQAAPTLGDTTSNQAIFFSSPFSPVDDIEPTYPNYTFPLANPPLEQAPENKANHTLLITLTSESRPFACSNSLGVITNQSSWYSSDFGWRKQFLVSGLLPSTNYTAHLVSSDTNTLSRPLYFVTKSASFACPLVHSLPYCPGVSWAVPLPPPPGTNGVYDNTNLPTTISDPIIQVLNNFTATLKTFPCGRDAYSPLQHCSDCHRAYRRWLCTISFKRCSEPSPSSPQSITPPQNAYQIPFDTTSSRVLSALVAEPTGSPRLLPCLEVCNKVERACPAFLTFKCPLKRFNAAYTYGVGYEDSGDELGEGLGVVPRGVQDQWGNVWCSRGY